ncbi:RHS repeat-associated core domain-containing protein [Methanolobus sp. WCC4]|uniref:RHS repeat-associated core domain-containing protein n=1 Tax=Methanolobus sp. WCC4 TaxID=3125784 RepID=UPI0030FAA96B
MVEIERYIQLEEDNQYYSYSIDENGSLINKKRITIVEALRYYAESHLSVNGLPIFQIDDTGTIVSTHNADDEDFYYLAVSPAATLIRNSSFSLEEQNAQLRAALTHPDILRILLRFNSRETLLSIWPDLDEILAGRNPFDPSADSRSIGGLERPSSAPIQLSGGTSTSDRRGSQPPGDSSSGGDPVLLALGDLILSEIDLEIPGVGLDIQFSRTYRHRIDYDGPMGKQWDHSYNLWLREALEDNIKGGKDFVVYVSSGSLRMDRFVLKNEGFNVPDDFTGVADAIFGSPAGIHECLIKKSGKYILLSPEGRRIFYNENLKAERISDLNGNEILFEYEDYLLIKIIDTSGREICLKYDDDRRLVRLIDKASDRWIQYEYDSAGRLVEVNHSTGREEQFQRCHGYRYLGNLAPMGMENNIVEVIDPRGISILRVQYGTQPKRLSYNRVVAQKEGKGIWIYDYESILPISSDPQLEPHNYGRVRVYVQSPDGNIHEYEYNDLGRVVSYSTREFVEGSFRTIEYCYRYNLDGRVIREERPEGGVIEYRYGREEYEIIIGDPETAPPVDKARFGELRKVIEYAIPGSNSPPKRITTFTYHPTFGYIEKEIGPYYAGIDELPINGPPSVTRKFIYDEKGNLIRVEYPNATLPDGSIQSERQIILEIDNRGRLVRRRIPMFSESDLVTRYDYFDTLGLEAYINKEICDEEGFALEREMEWDFGGRLVRLREADGLEVKKTFDHFGLVLREELSPHVSGGLPGITEFDYTKHDRVAKVKSVRMNSNGRLDYSGTLIQIIEYDDSGDPVKVLDQSGDGSITRKTIMEYSPDRLLISAMNPRGMVTKFTYNSRGQISDQILASGTADEAKYIYSYNREGQLLSVRDPLGNVECCEYDGYGRISRRISPSGTIEKLEWDALDKLTKRIIYGKHPDAGENTRLAEEEFERDEGGRLRKSILFVFDPAGEDSEEKAETVFFYDHADRLRKIEFPEGEFICYDYDGLGRIIKIEDAESNRIEREYDTINRTTIERVFATASQPDGTSVDEMFQTKTIFDILGNPILLEDTLGNQRILKWDSTGRRVLAKDELGFEIKETRDAFGDLQEMIVAKGTTEELRLQVVRDSAGEVQQINGPKGRVMEVEHDILGRPIIYKYGPSGSSEVIVQHRYDAMDNLVWHQDGNGVISQFKYTGDGHIERQEIDRSALQIPAGAAWYHVNGPSLIKFSYDGLGRPTHVADGRSFIRQRYDSRGLLISENTDGLTVSCEYDSASRLSNLKYPNGRTLKYEYDLAGCLTEIHQTAIGRNDPGSTDMTNSILQACPLGFRGYTARKFGEALNARTLRDPAGRLIHLNYYREDKNEPILEISRIFDSRGLPKVIQTDQDSTVWTESIQADAQGRVIDVMQSTNISLIDILSFSNVGTNVLSQSDFDNLSSNISLSIDSDPEKEEILFELFNDGPRERTIHRKSGSILETINYSVDESGRYTSIEGVNRIHDGHGNLIKNGNFSFVYDQENRLTTIFKGADILLKITYDPFGRMLTVSEGGVDKRYVYQNHSIIEVRSADGNPLVQYVHGISEADLVQIAQCGANFIPLTNLSGSLVGITDSSGNLISTTNYDVFGQQIAATEPALQNQYGFHGIWRADSQNLYLTPYRVYDSTTGRFLQPEPLGIIDGIDRYGFAKGNPYAWTDRLGLSATNNVPTGSNVQGGNSSDVGGIGEHHELSWWGRGVLAMGGAVWAVTNIFVEGVKQAEDLSGVIIEAIGIATGWWDYHHEVVSGIGKMAEGGMDISDVFSQMGKGIIETPGRMWDAAEKGDWLEFGSEGINIYTLGRSGFGFARASTSFAYNRGVNALHRLGPRGLQRRARIRNNQLGRMAPRVRRIAGAKNDLKFRYGGDPPELNLYGRYNIVENIATIYETSFVPKFRARLPTLTQFNPTYGIPNRNFLFTSHGMSRLLHGRSIYTTPVHEAWHSVQYAGAPKWIMQNAGLKPSIINPAEYTFPGNPFPGNPFQGAHNFAFSHAPPSPFSVAFGTSSALLTNFTKGGESKEK